MSAMLDERLRRRRADLAATHRHVPFHRLYVLVDAVMGQEPRPLARVACKHLGLLIK